MGVKRLLRSEHTLILTLMPHIAQKSHCKALSAMAFNLITD